MQGQELSGHAIHVEVTNKFDLWVALLNLLSCTVCQQTREHGQPTHRPGTDIQDSWHPVYMYIGISIMGPRIKILEEFKPLASKKRFD